MVLLVLPDFPTITSGDTIGFLDPHKRLWPGESGKRYPLRITKIPELESQFAVLNVLGCNVSESESYNGTLFRFPLRQRGSNSEISSSVWDTDRVLDVVCKSFQEDAHLILLFLKSVEKISLYHWIPPNRKPHTIFSTELSHRTIREVRTKRGELLECARKLPRALQNFWVNQSSEKCFRAEVMCTYRGKAPATQSWMVLHRIDNTDSDVRQMAESLHLSPWVGLAIPVGQETKHAAHLGKIFCFLPLPPSDDDSSMSGLPVHVHGSFALADNRRSLSWPARDRKHDPKAQWNYLLLERVLPVAYASLIYICTGQAESKWDIRRHDVYNAWPVPRDVREHWKQKVLPELFSMLSRERILYTEAQGGTWIRAEDAVILSSSSHDSSEQIAKQIMISRNICVVVVPPNVEKCLSDPKYFLVKRLSPEFVRNNLRGDVCPFPYATPPTHQLKLLKYILQDKAYSELQDVKLLPMADGTMETFETRHSTASPVYVSSNECPLSLFPGLEKHFLKPSIDADLSAHLKSIEMISTTQIQLLSPNEVPKLIKKILPKNRSLTIESPLRSRTYSWLSELWKWLHRHPLNLVSFEDCHIVPCTPNNCLVKLARDQPVIFRRQRENDLELVDEVVESLQSLGCVVVQSNLYDLKLHPRITDYILLPCQVLSCLARLSDHDVVAQLPHKARQPLLLYLARVLQMYKPESEDEKDVLWRLPLFQLRNSREKCTTSIQQCSQIAPKLAHLPNSLPVKRKFIKYPGPEEKKVLTCIDRSRYSYLSFSHVIENVVLPDIPRRVYTIDETIQLVKYILSHQDLANDQIFKKLNTLKFVPVTSKRLKSPAEVFDSADPYVTELFSDKRMLSSDDELERLIRSSPVEFKNISSVTARELLSLAQDASKGDNQKSKGLMTMLANETWTDNKLKENLQPEYPDLASALSNIAWLPCLTKRPSGYPSSVPWKAVSQTSKPSETLYVPSGCSTAECCNLVGSQQVLLDMTLREETVQILKFAPLTYDTVLGHLKTAVHCWNAKNADKDDRKQFGEMMQAILNVLGTPKPRPESVLDQLKEWSSQGIAWIWLDTTHGLVQLSQLVLEANDWRLEDWRFSVSNFSHLKDCEPLFTDLGMKRTWSDSDLMFLLKDVREFHSTEPKARTQIRARRDLLLCLDVLKLLTKDNNKIPVSVQSEVYVPVDGPDDYLELAPVSAVIYSDATSPLDVGKHRKLTAKLIHRDVSHATACALGVRDATRRSLLHVGARSAQDAKLLESSTDIPGEAFGQTEKLTDRLNTILRDYPKGEEILKELLQNADDAGATLLHVIYDKREHGTSFVFSPEWTDLQGPALCVYNDRVFTDKDIEGIQNLGRGSKREDPTLTGQYGIGFNAVYHLTDCPSFVTDNKTLCVLDPHCRFMPGATPEKPGRLIHDVRKNVWSVSRYRDITHCYKNLPDVKLVNGTLFRFPLRTESMARWSEISKDPVQETDILLLFEQFKESAADMLLFLNHICSIKLSVVDEQGHVFDSFEVSAEIDLDARRQRSELAAAIAKWSPEEAQHKEASYSMTVKSSDKRSRRQWLVYQCIGSKSDGWSRESELALLPRAGIAAPLDEKLPAGKSRAYCFLPLPKSVQPSLPVYVNGHFALDSSRRSLWQDSREGEHVPLSSRQAWNNNLIQFVIAPAYCHFLLNATRSVTPQTVDSKSESMLKELNKRLDWFNHLLPRNVSSSNTYWQLLSRKVYNFILNQKLALFPYVGCSLPSDRPVLSPLKQDRPNPEKKRLTDFDKTRRRLVSTIRWLAIEPENWLGLQPSYFFPSTISNSDEERVDNYMLKTILLDIGIPIVASSASVRNSLQLVGQSVGARTIDPAVVLLFLRHHRSQEVNCKLNVERIVNTILRTVDSAVILLKYVVSKDKFRVDELEGAPLLLTADDCVREFASESPVYVSQYSSLLPNHQKLFVHPDIYDVLTQADDSIAKASVVRPFSLDQLVKCLPSSGIYGCNWECITSRYVEWLDSTVDRLPTKEWITTFWRYLASPERLQENAIELLKPWPVVPAQHGTLLVPASLLSSLFCFGSMYTPDHDADMVKILRQLGVKEIDVELMNAGCSSRVLNLRTKKPPARLHSLVKDHVAVLDNHVSVLKALSYLYLDGTSWPSMNVETAERILKYIDNAVTTLQKNKMLHLIKRLPLFETAEGKLSPVGDMTCYVMPQDIVLDGCKIWTKRRNHVFLKYKPRFESLYSQLQLKSNQTCQEVYIDCILPSFPKMTMDQRIKHLIYLADCPKHSWLDVRAKLQETRCFDFRGKVEPIGHFYDPMDNFFKSIFPKDYFPPPLPSCTDEDEDDWLQFLRSLGLKTVCPKNVLEELADRMERVALSWTDLDQANVENWSRQSQLLCRHIFSKIDEYRHSFKWLREKKFVACREISNSLCDLADPFYKRNTQQYATSFGDAIKPSPENEQLCWTSAAILPDYAVPPSSADADQALGLKLTPNVQSVLDHFHFVTQQVIERDKLDICTRTVEGVVCQVFEYLEKFFQDSRQHLYTYTSYRDGNTTKEMKIIVDALSDYFCIFLPSKQLFVKPQQVVIELKKEIPPYLFKFPPYLQMYKSFLLNLGVAERVTPASYAQVLRNIHDTSLDETGNTDTVIKEAVYGLFDSLSFLILPSTSTGLGIETCKTRPNELQTTDSEDQLIKSLSPLYLPDRAMHLQLSSDLVYLDRPEFEKHTEHTEFHFLLDLQTCHLPPLKERTICLLPPSLRPKLFSALVQEVLHPDCMHDDVQDPRLQKVEEKYSNLLSSTHFAQGFYSIFTNKHRTTQLPIPVQQGLAMLQKCLRVKCLDEIRTCLQHIDSGDVIENSERTINCFLDKHDDGATLYLSGNVFSSDGRIRCHVTVFLKQLAKQIEILLQTESLESELMVLLECDDPADIREVVESIDIAYIHEGNDKQDVPASDQNVTQQQVMLGAPVHCDHRDLLNQALDDTVLRPDNWVAYESREEHFVYAKIVHKDYDDSSSNGTTSLATRNSTLHTNYVIDIGKDETMTVSALDLYSFDDVEVQDLESHDQIFALRPSTASSQETEPFDYVQNQLEEAWRLPRKRTRRVVKRLYRQWYSRANDPHASQVIELINENVRLHDESGFTDLFLSSLRTSVPSRRFPRSGKLIPRSTPFPDKQKGEMFLKQATYDLRAAEILYEAAKTEPQLSAAVCFHCHEAVEKTLKGILHMKEGIDEERSKTHELDYFLHALHSHDELYEQALVVRGKPRDYYLGTRYPDHHRPCRVPGDWYSLGQAERVLQETQRLVPKIQSAIAGVRVTSM